MQKILPAFICLAFVVQACTANKQVIGTSTEAIQSAVSETPSTVVVEQSTNQPDFSPVLLKAGYGYSSSWIDLYFTDPASFYSEEEAGGVDGVLSASIVSARESVDVAINSLSLSLITKALIRAKERGVRIRVVMESDYLDAGRPNPQALVDAGIPIVGDKEEDRMNNNFIIIDNKQVWTGSMTYTATGIYHGYDYLVSLDSEEIAQNFTQEFEEMFVNFQFGPNVVPDTPNPQVIIKGSLVETFFLPDDLFALRLSELVKTAKESIVFTALTFTSKELGDLIRKMAEDNIVVTGIINDFKPDPIQISQYELFKQAGLDVRLGSPDITLFSNFIIIDNETVILGTYNFDMKAEISNDGNVLIIHNEPIAKKFLDEFQRIQATSQK